MHLGRDAHARLPDALLTLFLGVCAIQVDASDAQFLDSTRPAPDTIAARWTEFAPPARSGHVAIFDARRHRMVVFGGPVWAPTSNTVWFLSAGPHPRWEKAEPVGTPPQPRFGAAAVHDARRDRALLIGGEDGSGRYNDVWELSLAGPMRWRRLECLGEPPAGRAFHSATLDPEHGRVLVFGGGSGSTDLGDSTLWELKLSRLPTWSRLDLPGRRPPPRMLHSAAYVHELHGIVLFGGFRRLCRSLTCGLFEWQNLCDTWFLSTGPALAWTEWTSLVRGGPLCGVEQRAVVYDPGRFRLVAFGGLRWSWPTSESWILELGTLQWSMVPLGHSPAPRGWASAVLDEKDRRMLLYGGSSNWGGSPMADAWALDLDDDPRWSRVLPDSGLPAAWARYGRPAIYQPGQDRVIMYQDGSVWTYSLKGGSGWMPLSVPGESPAARTGALLVHDSRRDRALLLGGISRPYDLPTDAWALSLGSAPRWERVDASGTAPEGDGFAGVYDPLRDRVVLFDGGGYPFEDHGVWGLSFGGEPVWGHLLPAWPRPFM